MSIVLTTHNMEEAENLCHKVAIMDKGKIITEGSPNDLIAKFDSDNTEKVILKTFSSSHRKRLERLND